MEILTCQFTNPGGRDPNEDSVGYFNRENQHAWIAADGLGGHVSGEIASAEAVKTLEKEFNAAEKIDEAFMIKAFKRMNRAILDLEGPLTTAVCAFSDGEKLWYGNEGDSRLYFIRNKKLIHHTNDHSVAYVDYLDGEVSYDEISSHPMQNRLYHSLGTEYEYFGEFYPVIQLEPEDAFLLATDGFWELITTEEVVKTRLISATPQEWLSTMLDIVESRLVPTSDNYSAVCVIVK